MPLTPFALARLKPPHMKGMSRKFKNVKKVRFADSPETESSATASAAAKKFRYA